MLSAWSNLDSARQAPILNAALREFARKGFAAASTNEIVREAGISKGLLFHYFKTKADLFLFLFDYSIDLIKAEYLDVFNIDEPDIFARYRQAALLKIELIRRHPHVLDFVGVAATTTAEQVREQIERRRQALHALSQRRLFENVDTGRFADGIDPARAIRVITWTIEGYEKQAQDALTGARLSEVEYGRFLADFDAYIDLLRRAFYR